MTAVLQEIKSVLEELQSSNQMIDSLNDKLKHLRKKANDLEENAIAMIGRAGYKGRPMRLGGHRYTLMEKDTRDGFSQHVVRAGIETYLRSKGQPTSAVEDMMRVINEQRKVSKKAVLKIEPV